MRVAVISDVHSNLPALEAVVAAAGHVDAWWHLGDIVGYGPHPNEVVERLRDLGAVGVLGNHDAAALGSDVIESFNPDAYRAAEWTRTVIRPKTRAWLAALEEEDARSVYTLVHGSPRDPIWEYITSADRARGNLAALATRHCLHGHTHVPIAWREREARSPGGPIEAIIPGPDAVLGLDERRCLVNPGSVGQPRDGDPDASFCILDTETDAVTWRRVAYPIPETQAAMRAAGLPERLALRLEVGH